MIENIRIENYKCFQKTEISGFGLHNIFVLIPAQKKKRNKRVENVVPKPR
jgi:AAA15 family ATPase/GTPase